MCVDYRDINAQTEKNAYPLPRIDQVWPVMAKARYFAPLDLLMGYHQVEVEPKDRFKTVFVTQEGFVHLQYHAFWPLQCSSDLSASNGKDSWNSHWM